MILRMRNNFLIFLVGVTCLLMVPLIDASFALANDIPTRDARLVMTLGKKAGLNLPTDVAVDTNGNIYVVDSGNNRVAVFSRRGRFLRSFGKTGKQPGQFRAPIGITISTDNQVYVADKGNNRIQIFNLTGKLLRTFKTIYKRKPVRPVDVAVNPRDKQIFVTGNANHRVMVYSGNGKLLRHWGGEGVDKARFRYPATTVLSPTGKLYVVDVLNTRVQVFERSGKHIVDVGAWGVLPGQFFRPKGVAIDNNGSVYVSDSYMGVIQVFDHDHRFRHVIGSKGKPKIFSTPSGIFIDSKRRLYISEMLDNRVTIYKLR